MGHSDRTTQVAQRSGSSVDASVQTLQPSRVERDRRLQRLQRRLAALVLALMLVVTTASAWLRLAQPRAPCADWPACRSAAGRMAAPVQPPVLSAPAVLAVVRGSHRVAASAALVMAIALVVSAMRWNRGGQSDSRDQGEQNDQHDSRARIVARDASALLVLALALSVLGIVTPGSRSLAVLLGNLLGGLLMVALAARLVALSGLSGVSARDALAQHATTALQTRRRRIAARAATIGLALWLLQAALGAGSGFGAGALASPLHAALGFFAAAWAFHAGGTSGDAGATRAGALLRAIAVAQGLLGVTVAALDAPAALVLVHNGITVLAVALLAAATTAGTTLQIPDTARGESLNQINASGAPGSEHSDRPGG